MAASRLGKSKPCLLLPLLSLLGCTLAVQLHQQMPTEVPPSSVSNLLVQSAMDSLNEGQAFKSGVLAKARKVVVMKPPYVLYKLTLNLIPACRDPEESCPRQACTLDVRQHEGGVIDVLKNSIQCVHIEPETKQSNEKEIIENIEKQIINQGTSLDQEVQTSAEHNDRPFVAVRASHSDYCPGCPYELNPSLPGLHSFTYLTEKSMDEVTRGDFKHKVISILKVSRSVPPTIRIIQYELMMEIGETTCLKTTNIKVSNCPIQPNLPINICAVYFEEYPWQEETRRLTRNNCTDVLNTDNEVSGNYDPYSYRFESAAPNREEDVSSKTEFYDQIAQEAQEVSRLNPEIGTEKELTPTKITIEKNIESEEAPKFHEKMKQFDEFLEDFDLPIKLETTTPKYLGVPVTEKLFIKEKVEEKVIEKQSSIKPSIKPTEEIASTKLTEDPKNTKLIEEPTPTSTKLAEESRSTILIEEPTLTSTKLAEEPSSTKLTEEPTPTSTKFIEEPKSTKLSQEPISTQIPEELTSISIKLTEGQTSTKLTEEPTPNTKFTDEATSTKLTEEPTPTSTKLPEEPIPTNMKLAEVLIKINQENTKTKDLVLNPTVESVRSKRSTKPLENNKSMLRKLAIIAVEMLDNLDEDNKKKHVIDVIDSQRERKEHGIVYYITVEVAPTDCSEKDKNTECLDEVIPGPTQICYMDVAINEKKPLESPKLLQYKCKNKQKSELRFKRQMLGAPTSHSPDDPEVQKFVKLGLKKYSDGYQGTYEPIISNVKEVSVQVVSGLLYKIKTDIGVSTCKKGISENCLLNSEEGVKECVIEAWSQPWMDNGNPKITVKCNEDKRKKRSLKGQNYTQKMLKQSRELKEEKLFNEFIIKYERNYESNEEKERRFKIFRDNLDMIEELQRNEQGTGRYGVTRFADLTKAEFKSNYLGLKPTLKSENDIPMPMAEIPDIPLPKEFDWRTKNVVTDVKDQGSCGSCWAFSVTGNVEGQYAIKHGKLLSLSEQELVDCDKLDDGCNGGLPDNAYRAIEEIGGLELESDYPYDAEAETCHFNKNKVKVNVVSGLNITSNETQMAQWLVKNGPMSIGINANAMQFYIGGVSHPFHFLCSPDDLDHGVLIVGYGIKTYPIFKKKMPYWIIKNSWGPRWGEQGYYRIYRGDGTCGVNKMVTSAVIA